MLFAEILHECRQRHEAARPKRGWFGIGGGKVGVDHGSYEHTLGKAHDKLFADGRVVWAATVMANTALYSPGKLDLPCAVVYSFDSYYDSNVEELAETASQIYDLKDTEPLDPELREVAQVVTDETARECKFVLPAQLTGGRAVRFETLYIQRQRLPTGRLIDPILPVIIDAKRPTQVMLLPLEFWSPRLVAHWKKQATLRPPPEEPKIAPDGAADYAANPITLTPVALREIRMLIKQHKLKNVKMRVVADHGAYMLDLVQDEINPQSELVTHFEGLPIVVSRASAQELMGIVVDLKQSPAGKGFVFLNSRRTSS